MLLVAWLAACGGSDGPSPPGPDDAGTPDAGTDAGPECEPGSHATAAGCDSTLSWTTAGAIEGARDHHATFVVTSGTTTRLFVAGGTDRASFFDDVQVTTLGEGGMPGAWTPTTSLPAPLAGHSVATVGDAVVVTGGLTTGGALTDETWASVVDGDGAPGAWASGPPLPLARMHHCMAADGDRVYVVGGLLGVDTTDGVSSAAIDGDTIGAWRDETPLPESRSHEGCVVVDGALWVVGGLSGNPAGVNVPFDDVLFAPIGADGALGAWQTATEPMPHALGTHSAIAFGGRLWTIGGIEDDAVFTDAVRRATVAQGGTGAWEDAGILPRARGHVHQTPIVGTHVYSIGGSRLDGSVLSDVFVGTFE